MSIEDGKISSPSRNELLALFVFNDMARVQNILGLIQSEVKSSLRVAVRQTGQWANREGARGLAKATNTPLNVLRKGLRLKYDYKTFKGVASGRLWYGLNSISAKFLNPRQQSKGLKVRGATYKGGFISPKLGGHSFRRVGKSRIPLVRIDHEVNQKAEDFLKSFEVKVAEQFINFFFAAIDKMKNREMGESQAIAGNMNFSTQ